MPIRRQGPLIARGGVTRGVPPREQCLNLVEDSQVDDRGDRYMHHHLGRIRLPRFAVRHAIGIKTRGVVPRSQDVMGRSDAEECPAAGPVPSAVEDLDHLLNP